MDRAQTLYTLYYSYRLLTMFSVILGRFDKFLSCMLLLLGSSVIGRVGNPLYIGLMIALITAFRMAYNYEATSESARKQASRYINLYTRNKKFDDDSLTDELTLIQKDDPNPWSGLMNPANLQTNYHLTLDDSLKLGKWEKFLLFFAS